MSQADSGDAAHWDDVFARTSPDQVSWYESEPSTSLELISESGVEPDSAVDIGAGRSPLASSLLARGWSTVFALDISAAALAQLADHAGHPPGLTCVVSNVLTWRPDQQVSLWHDRAVFHFLTASHEQASYAELAATTVVTGGVLILAAFAPDGPDRCSGLPVARHDAASIDQVFGHRFELTDRRRIEHQTPWGAIQPFTWVTMRRSAEAN